MRGFFVKGAYQTARKILKEKWPEVAQVADGKSVVAAVISPSASSRTPSARVSKLKLVLSETKRLGLLSVKAIKFLARALKYLHRRAPDHYELAHRLLCERAIATSSMPPPSSALAKGATPAVQARKMLFGAASIESRPASAGATITTVVNTPERPPTVGVPLNTLNYSFRGGMNAHHLQLNHARRRSEDEHTATSPPGSQAANRSSPSSTARSPAPTASAGSAFAAAHPALSSYSSETLSASHHVKSSSGAMGLTIPSAMLSRPVLGRAASEGQNSYTAGSLRPEMAKLIEQDEEEHEEQQDHSQSELRQRNGSTTAIAMASPEPQAGQWYS